MKLRCFFTIHQQEGSVLNPTFRKTRSSEDFDEGTKPQEAYRSVFAKYGKLGDSKLWDEVFPGQRIKIAPTRWVEIHSHTVVDETLERPVTEGFKAQDQDLFAPMELKRALSDKPKHKYHK